MLIIARIIAQIIDLLVGFIVLMVTFLGILPVFSPYLGPIPSAIVVILLFIALCFGVQYPFLKNNQTIGKAFFMLEYVPTKPEMPLTIPLLVHREIFCKLMSCYLICLPILAGKPGGHEAATGIRVMQKQRKRPSGG